MRKTMKRTVKALFAAAILFCNVSAAQTTAQFFILGTLSDYMGRNPQSLNRLNPDDTRFGRPIEGRDANGEFIYVKYDSSALDRYYPYEKDRALFIQNFIDKRYGQSACRIEMRGEHSSLYSRTLTPIIDSLYRLQEKAFTTKEQKYAYMYGICFRSQVTMRTNDSLYMIGIANSDKGRIFHKMAAELGFKNLSIKEINNMPHITRVRFTPTDDFLRFIAPLEKEVMDAGVGSYIPLREPDRSKWLNTPQTGICPI